MAQAKIFNDAKNFLGFVVSKNIFSSKVSSDNRLTKIENAKRVYRVVGSKNYAIPQITENKRNVVIKEQLPFRVRFINIGIESYGPNNPPPIGIAIIGFNNYIL